MPDDPKVNEPVDDEPKSGSGNDDDQPNDAHDDDLEDEELYDSEGKPLPWAKSKRFRKIYNEAKEARDLKNVLAESGLSATDLRGALSELGEFRAAYTEWRKAKDAGETTPSDDAEAAELKKRERALVARLKEMGFMTKEDFEAQKSEETHSQHTARVAYEGKAFLFNLLQTEGFVSKDMDDDEIQDVMAEWDAKVGRRILREPADARAFASGDKRVISKHFKAALSAMQKRSPASTTKPNINGLPKRIGTGPAPRAKGSTKEAEPTSIREAAAQMLAEMGG